MTTYSLTESERRTYRRYASLPLPRHTSYPAVPVWRTEYGPAAFREDLGRSARQRRALSLYAHVPFCEKLCYYCACTKEIVPANKRRRHDPSDSFLEGLERETSRFADILGSAEVRQVHLGGGSPTFLRPEQLQRLWTTLRNHFAVAADAEIAVEVGPRITTLTATVVAGDPEDMLRCVIQEYAWMGWNLDQLMCLFRDPFFPALFGLWNLFGEAGLRRRMAAIFDRTGVFQFQARVVEEAEPDDEEPELIQLGWRPRPTATVKGDPHAAGV